MSTFLAWSTKVSDAVERFIYNLGLKLTQPIQERMDAYMSELQLSLDELNAAVAGLAGRVQDKVAELEAALATVHAEFDAYQTSEDTEDIEQNAALQGALADADTAAAEIRETVGELNAIAAPEAPTEPEAPAEPEVPTEPEAPVAEEPVV